LAVLDRRREGAAAGPRRDGLAPVAGRRAEPVRLRDAFGRRPCDPHLVPARRARRAAGAGRHRQAREQAMSAQEQQHRRRRRSRRRVSEVEEEGGSDVGRIDWPRFILMIANGLVLLAFLLLIMLAPLPLGANREWGWAPILVALGGLSILVALGLGNPRGFRVEPEERWPLLALL